MNSNPGKLIRIYVSEHDQHEGKPLYEAIVSRCQELQLAGVTVFRGLEGYGHTSEVHRVHLFAHDQPIVITIIETPEKAAQAIPLLQRMMKSGVIAVTDVEVTVVSNGTALPLS
jgi:PII-like signaling protein